MGQLINVGIVIDDISTDEKFIYFHLRLFPVARFAGKNVCFSFFFVNRRKNNVRQWGNVWLFSVVFGAQFLLHFVLNVP